MNLSDLVMAVWTAVYKGGIPPEKFKEAFEMADNIAHIAISETYQEAQQVEPPVINNNGLRLGTKIHKVYQALITGPKSVNDLRKVSGASVATVYGYVKQLKAKRQETDGAITYSLQ